MSYSALSEDEIQQKLDQIRTTPQTDFFLQQVHGAHKDVLSKTGEIKTLKQEWQSIQSQHTQLGEKLQKDIKAKNVYVEQVHATHTDAHVHVCRASIWREIRMPVRTSDRMQAILNTHHINSVAKIATLVQQVFSTSDRLCSGHICF